MGNCCAVPKTSDTEEKKRGKNKPKPFSVDYVHGNGHKSYVLDNPTGSDIEATYELGRELGRGVYACKSKSKKKLRTRVDIEDIRREVEIMKHLPKHPNIATLKGTYEDDNAVHILMELCEGGELFDRIVARGHYINRAAATATCTIVDVIQDDQEGGRA
ncbi:Calcium-dependent protein kinase 32 [Capsicum chinense]|nr:Calcium-dependent protein kinase 32 [Capsicum chinense]